MPLADSKALRISTDIAPIHSLVSQVVGDRISVDLIIPSNQTPHDFAVKPSQIRALNNADLIVLVSENFTPSIGRYIKSLNKQQNMLSLADLRITHESDQSTEQNNSSKTTASDHAHLLHDEHTWLNPLNTIAWLEHIAAAVSGMDEDNRAEYEHNASIAIAQTQLLHQSLLEQLSSVRKVPYVVYHDAYQHFANAFDLSKPYAIALSDARAPGAAKLKQMRQVAQQSKCAFSERQHDDAIVDTISAGFKLKRGVIDPLGSDIPPGPNLYNELMNALAGSFLSCLSD